MSQWKKLTLCKKKKKKKWGFTIKMKTNRFFVWFLKEEFGCLVASSGVFTSRSSFSRLVASSSQDDLQLAVLLARRWWCRLLGASAGAPLHRLLEPNTTVTAGTLLSARCASTFQSKTLSMDCINTLSVYEVVCSFIKAPICNCL